MKLHCHPISTTSRPAILFVAETGMAVDLQMVDLFSGEHHQPAFDALNPNRLIPVLEDGDFRLTESSAILKYLADKADSPLYPKDLQQRARVHERMDWINTQVCRDLCYGVVYPQIMPHHKRRSDEAQASTLQWSKERAQGWLKVLDQHILGEKNTYLCGDKMTIADFYGASFVALAETVGSDFSAYPNVRQWLGRMKALKSWKQTYEAIDGYAATLKGKEMVAV
jgi:glutathione S-transferase